MGYQVNTTTNGTNEIPYAKTIVITARFVFKDKHKKMNLLNF